jgi:lactate permease
MWSQSYDPLHNAALSTAAAALPAAVLLAALGLLRLRAHTAALLGVLTSLIVAVWLFHMPARMAASATLYGAAYGLFPIGWIVLNVIFLYRLTNERGLFGVLRHSVTHVTRDRRLQLLLVAFCLGAFMEGAAGFGTPVAVTAAILIGLGFAPLQASGLSLIANTAPVAFGALGTPIVALQSVTNLDLFKLSAMVGRQLPIFSLIVPFWLIVAFAGFRAMLGVFPALLVAGAAFAVPQFLLSNYHGPWLAGVASGVVSMAALALLLRVWQPRTIWTETGPRAPAAVAAVVVDDEQTPDSGRVFRAWLPWIVLSVLVFIWGIPQVKAWLDGISSPRLPVAGLHNLVARVPPVVPAPKAETAVFILNWLSATGSGILLAAHSTSG